jgi:L,D-peptidoglycan transpeptidase YkuD (ErfK/YbiS/YcfS/YnhG family)
LIPLDEKSGWCDDVNSPEYNQFVRLPCNSSHEQLWRKDHLYDVIIVIGYNDDPVIKHKGSAIFLHIAKPNYEATAGCIGLKNNYKGQILNYNQQGILPKSSTLNSRFAPFSFLNLTIYVKFSSIRSSLRKITI